MDHPEMDELRPLGRSVFKRVAAHHDMTNKVFGIRDEMYARSRFIDAIGAAMSGIGNNGILHSVTYSFPSRSPLSTTFNQGSSNVVRFSKMFVEKLNVDLISRFRAQPVRSAS